MDDSLSAEIWKRLFRGKTLDGLPLETKEGRTNLSGLVFPEPAVVRRYQTVFAAITQKESAVVHKPKWKNLDFSGGELSGLRIMGGELQNCRFDKCGLQDLRVWATQITETSFRGADLRKAALGGVQDGRRNNFRDVDFTDADLRQTAYTAAAFERCVFRNAKLVKIDFQTSTFVDCRFEGELREVLFYDRGFKGEAFPPNEMVNVDFSRAELHFVEFRGLSLDRVHLPEDEAHIVIRNVASVLDKMLHALRQEDDITAKTLVAYLAVKRKWVAPNQAQEVINLEDVAEIAGEEGVKRFRELLRCDQNKR